MAAPLTILAVRLLLTRPVQLTLSKYGPQFFGGTGLATALARFERLKEWAGTDAEATAIVSGSEGYPVTVATYTGSFELRKMVVQFTHADAAIVTDDVRQMSVHLAKLAGGLPAGSWVQADFDAAVAATDAWWSGIKPFFHTAITYDRLKFYKDGPEIVPPNPPVYDIDKAIPGTSSSGSMPPQVAISVTEIAGTKRYWGRFYLPAPAESTNTTYGRIDGTVQSQLADACDTWYQALVTAGLIPVVYRRHLPARFTKAAERAGATEPNLPERAASAWTVEKLQVDDVFDVIRSRRFKYPSLRVQREIS